ncbi:hypothetical protein ACFCYI_12300 [Streptomyces sp. NPDC056257]|uniref:hypothetical protein n=1 Tax=Streptomyces sp. NPDC056257 TaxID=3345765 RepID=UPI0035D5A511
MPFHVRLRFGPPPSPAVTGTWDGSEIAERKFRGFIGRYGSRENVRIEDQADSARQEISLPAGKRGKPLPKGFEVAYSGTKKGHGILELTKPGIAPTT